MSEFQELRPDNIRQALTTIADYALSNQAAKQSLANDIVSSPYGINRSIYATPLEAYYDVVTLALPEDITEALSPSKDPRRFGQPLANSIVEATVVLVTAYDDLHRGSIVIDSAENMIEALHRKHPFVSHEGETLPELNPRVFRQVTIEGSPMPAELESILGYFVGEALHGSFPRLLADRQEVHEDIYMTIARTTYALLKHRPGTGLEENPIGAPLLPPTPQGRRSAAAPIPDES